MISLSSPAMGIYAFHIFPSLFEGLRSYFSQLHRSLWVRLGSDRAVYRGRIDSIGQGYRSVLDGALFDISLLGLSFLMFPAVAGAVVVGVFGYG